MDNKKQPAIRGQLWMIQALSGLGLIVLLGLHMIAHHFVAPNGLRNYQQVIEYVSSPLILMLEIVFLLVVTPHALLGARAIIFDLGLDERTQHLVNILLGFLGVVAIGYGVYLALVLQSRV